jgi:outer membrane biosynthesis protein TonB
MNPDFLTRPTIEKNRLYLNCTILMKSLFVSLFFSALLIFAGDVSAQTPVTTPKAVAKPTAPASAAQKAKPTTATTAKKVKKPASKPTSKGLFDDDYDGEVGIKYIGTDPVPDAELAKVKEIQEAERGTKAVKTPAPKKVVVAPAKKAEPVKVEAATTETVDVTPVVKPEVKKEKPVVKAEAKKETKPVVKAEVVTEAQPDVAPIKPAVKPASKSTKRGAHAEFDVVTINLGTIKEDAVEERSFEFTNTGTTNLEILECHGSCGCTQPRAESSIVGPGERSRIFVKYVARNKVGPQKPVVTLTTNGSPSVIRLFLDIWVDQIPGGVKDPTPAPIKSENN